MDQPKPHSAAATAKALGAGVALLAEARRLLAERFGYKSFRPGQEESLQSVFSRRNLLAVMPTGSGKSLLYQLPAIMDASLTLVVSPLISLMKDQVDELARRGIPATFVNSSLTIEEQRERLRLCTEGKVRLLYVAPERFRNEGFLAAVSRIKVARMAVDEAHCISEWGHDFRPDYLRLKDFRDRIGTPLVTALTATATAQVQRDIVDALGLAAADVDVHVHGFDRPNLVLGVRKVANDEDKNRFIADFLKSEPGCGIVYVGTRRTADDLAGELKSVEPRIAVYHAGMESDERTAAQERFLGGKSRVVVATSAFGMGIDKPDVRFVIHYNYPGSVEQYYQEIGRAGRDGKTSRCVLLYASADHFLREFFIDLNYPSREQIKSVYDTLMELPENPIMLTYREIADLCEEDVKEGQVGAAIRLLDTAGVTKAFSGEQRIAVTLARPAAQSLSKVSGPMQRRVLEALSFAADLEKAGRYEVSLSQLCTSSGLGEDQVRRALGVLDREGHIQYEPPFRGRGIQKAGDSRVPFHKLPIDWKRHDARRAAEAKKLETIEAYITGPSCRREFILRYFGEDGSLRCGTCDRCDGQSAAGPAGGGIFASNPHAAKAVLVCVRHLKFGIGKGRIAQVLAGSRDKDLMQWGLNVNPAYGVLQSRRDDVKGVIDALIREGYLDTAGEAARPVLKLTDAGREAADAVSIDDLHARPAEAPRIAEARPGIDPADAKAAILACVASLRPSLGMTKVAGILTGSKAAWVADIKGDAVKYYGVLACSQDRVSEIIAEMLKEGLLTKGGNDRYPVLEAAAKGDEAAPESIRAPLVPPERGPEHTADDAAAELPQEEDADVLDGLIGLLLDADGEAARERVGSLRVYSPREITSRLVAIYEATTSLRRRSRIVWAAGEMCGRHGVAFLAGAAASSEPDVRRLAASALGKAIAAMTAESKASAGAVELARKALSLLADDMVPQVRQYAAKAIGRLD